MARINLLPWREIRRKERQKEYLTLLGFAALTTGILVGFVHIHVNGLIDYQDRRNQYLENEIKILDNKIREIKSLEATKKALLERMNVIENLQAARPGVVHLFDELIATLPEGTYLTSIQQNGEKLSINGKAESNARVSAYMRNINKSEWLDGAKLNVIQSKAANGMRISDFKLQASMTTPQKKKKELEQLAARGQ